MPVIKLALIPDKPLLKEDHLAYGQYTSDLRRINVNRIPATAQKPWDFTILIIPEDLTEILETGFIQKWLGTAMGTLTLNIPNDTIELVLSGPEEWHQFGFSVDSPLYAAWKDIDRMLMAVVKDERIQNLVYHPLPEPQRDGKAASVTDLLSSKSPKGNLGDIYHQFGMPDNDDDDMWVPDDVDDTAEGENEPEDDEDEPKRRKLGPSKVLTHAKNPKRDLNRHGVIIADSRDDLEKDRKMIKAFLKEFIPGDQYWKRELRRTLAQRWIRVYAVSKKTHKELEKEFRRGKSRSTAETVLSFTRGIFTTPLDSWDDPSR